jgi:hypothetical protein
LVPAHARVARFFAFQNSAGPSGTDFTLFDAAVRGARRAGVRLQLVLDDDQGGCSSGVKHDTTWFAGGYQQPEGNFALSYRDFAESLARRYRDEPTVLGYLLIQGFGRADKATLASFATDMGQRIHGLAPNQLLSVDLGWSGDAETYVELERLPVVDFVDLDDYTFEYPARDLDPQLLQALTEIDKPVIVGEGAFVLLGADNDALRARALAVSERMSQWRAWGFSGALLWAYQPGWIAVSEEFDARPADPLLQPGGVLASAPW